ncbi:zinc-dependent alcohol dehydrogenase family protein [Leucobacter sp. CSA1]|uniref:Zinc-dependent alcohol dehydrogenase family protein n=1 Tax=Leucobacter chromiisoli TaxID=2796471 RepID=A0A934UUP0_9MICO|nr:zinc-dependent alcohol dehydrogenase family protein [Leucobacter chromiisoli]MBK0418383.1 zinc-dependent alcohol dehydrogenase family protein [Leucobacter chromiisoli]
MRSIVYSEPEHFSLQEVPLREPGDTEVVIEVDRAGVCGTDLHLHHGEFGPAYPLVPGHELTGRVVARGSAVTSPEIGDRVVADNTVACGTCTSCRRGYPVFCERGRAHGVNRPGAFADAIILEADRCFVVNDLDPDVAVLAEPAACVMRGLDVLGAAPGSNVLVFGAGPTGLLMAQLLKKNAGTERVVVAAPSQHKLDLARAHGADLTVRVDRADPAAARAALRADAPEGYDIVVDATGAVAVLQQTIGLTRTGGTVLVYGMADEEATWPVRPYEIFRRELTIKGSFAQQFVFDRAIAALRSGTIDTTGIITHRFGLDQYREALDAISDSACVKAVIEPRR